MEAVQVIYDPGKVSYKELLDYFFRHVDPTDAGGQFVDRGEQYRSAIFYHDEEQKRLAEESRKEIEKSGYYVNKVSCSVRSLSISLTSGNSTSSYVRSSSMERLRFILHPSATPKGRSFCALATSAFSNCP